MLVKIIIDVTQIYMKQKVTETLEFFLQYFKKIGTTFAILKVRCGH